LPTCRQVLNSKPAFTLAELIVSIVILAILATIAFFSFNDYSRSARDSVRLSDINMIAKSLELSRISV
jgi:prepilin-type N-terminal cleavage/methylation domain-containing protein